MKRSIFLYMVFLLLLAGMAIPAGAQDIPMEGTLPDSIVVTATRLAEHARKTGRRITVWTAREIQQLPVSSFDELLRTVGGVEVFSRNGFGVQSDLTMRGSTFNGVLILVDGARLNDPQTGHFASDLPVPLAEIARIEVLRGPASALYGPDALGGVIHIITHTALLDGGSENPFHTVSLAGTLGAYALYGGEATGRYVAKDWSVGLTTSLQRTDGETVYAANGLPVDGPNGRVRTDYNLQGHSLGYTRRLGSVALFTRLGMDRRDFNAFHFYTISPLDFSREETETYWGQVRLRNAQTGFTNWQVNTAFKQHHDYFDFNPAFPANDHTSRMITVQGQVSHQLNTQWTVVGGASAEARDIDSNNLGQHDDKAGGVFLQAQYQPTTNLSLYLGNRLDYDGAYGLEPAPHFSAAYTMPRWTLRANAGRSIRAPNYVERYYNFFRPRQAGRDYGNPDLETEHAWAYEAGADLYPTEGVSLHATAFQRHTTNLIDFAKIPAGSVPVLADSVLLAQNILSVDTRGLEWDLEAHRNIGTGRIHLSATWTLLDSDLGDVAKGTVFKYANAHAKNLVQVTTTFILGQASLGVQGMYKEKLDQETYGLLNLKGTYRLAWGRQHVILTGEVRNLLDEQYTEILDAPMPGRWWLFGLRFGL